MYNVSNAYKTAIASLSRRTVPRITLGATVLDGTYIQNINLSQDIMPSGDFEIGIAPMSTVSIGFINKDNGLDGIVFENQELYVELGTELADSIIEYVPLGYFTVTEAPVKKNKIATTSKDRMHKFEKPYTTDLAFPTTLRAIASEVCTKAGVELATPMFVNSNVSVTVKPALDGVTLRKAIAQVAELAGGFARINRAGQLEIININMVQAGSITNYAGADYIASTGAKLLNDAIEPPIIRLDTKHYINFSAGELQLATIDKVIVKTGDVEATQGDGDYSVYVVDNIFCQDPSSIVAGLYSTLNGITYHPCELKWIGNPAIDVGDTLRVFTKKGAYITVAASRELIYTGGLRETYKAPAKSNTAKESKHEGSLTVAVKNAIARISVLADSISLIVSNGVDKVRTAIGKFDDTGFEVSHTDVGTKTLMAAEGFKIKDADTNEDLASFGTDNGLPNIRVNQAYIYGKKMIEERSALYVNSSTGNDLTADGTSAKPYKTISAAINSLGRILTQDTYIFVTGIFYENIEIRGIGGAGVLYICMSGATLNGNFNMKYCTCFVYIYGGSSSYGNVKATGTPQPVNVEQCNGVKLLYMNLDGGGLSSSVINMWMSFLEVNNCIVKGGTAFGMYFTTCNATIDTCKGSNIGYGIFAGAGSLVGIKGTVPSGTLSATVVDSTSIIQGTATATSDTSTAGTTITTRVCNVTDTGSWRSSTGWRTDNERVYQGAYQTATYGINKGLLFFGAGAFNVMIGKTIKSAKLRIKRYNGGGSSAAQAVYFYVHGYETQPAEEPLLGVSLGNLCDLAWGEEASIALPQAFLDGVSGGSIKGIAIYNNAINPYVILCADSEYTASIEFQYI